MDKQYTTEDVMTILRRLTRIETCCYNEGLPELLPLILDIRDLLNKAVFDERQRKVLELYFLKEYTQEEVAREINTSQVTVSTIISTIRKAINEVIENA